MRSVPLPACLVLAKEFVDRVERIEHKLSLLDRVVREEEKKVSDERELMETSSAAMAQVGLRCGGQCRVRSIFRRRRADAFGLVVETSARGPAAT